MGHGGREENEDVLEEKVKETIFNYISLSPSLSCCPHFRV
jgi:hypothetical protein